MYGAKIARVASVVGAQQDRTWGSPNRIRDEKVQRSSVYYSLSLIWKGQPHRNRKAHAKLGDTIEADSNSNLELLALREAWRNLASVQDKILAASNHFS